MIQFYSMTKTILRAGLALALGATSLTAQSKRTYIEFDGERQHLVVSAHVRLVEGCIFTLAKTEHPLVPIREGLGISRDDSYTISYWMWGSRAQGYTAGQRILSRLSVNKATGKPTHGYDLLALRNTNNHFAGYSLTQRPDSNTNNSVSAWASPAPSTAIRSWHHIAVVLDKASGNVLLYIDGELRNTTPAPKLKDFTLSEAGDLFIGCGTTDGKTPTGHFGGRLDNLRLYRRALSAKEVKQDLETMSISPRTAGLVAAFDFDGYKSGDSTVTDVTGRYTAQLKGFPETLDHPLVRTYAETKTNGHLIGRTATQALSSFTLGLVRPDKLSNMKVSLAGTTNLTDIKALKVYATEIADRFDPRKPGVLVAETNRIAEQTILHPARKSVKLDRDMKLWLVADITADAAEGSEVMTSIQEITFASQKHKPFTPKVPQTHTHEIVLERTLVWTPGEEGVASYRIPGIVRMDDGSLVASIDRRKNSDYDLPENIDVEVKISHDNGRSWSAPITVARGTADHGYGDAAMVSDGKTIYMVMVAGSGLWNFPTHAKKPLEMYFTQSTDGGRSWAPVREISQEVYTDRYPNGGFFGSGNGLITSRGRICFVAAMRTEARWGGQMDNVVVYSDDQGKTWQSSPVARVNGDEAKIAELANGDLIISSRNRAGGANERTFVVSSDHGQTWSRPGTWAQLKGNACNASLTRYSLAHQGKGKNILLHTLLHSGHREKLTLFLSEDDGRSWPVSRLICEGEAAYSELVVFPDGSIGIISEENDRPAYDIYFTRVSLDWLMRGDKKK